MTLELILYIYTTEMGSLPANVGDVGLIPGLGRSLGGHGNPLQYSCLENPMNRGAWQAKVYGVSKESDMTERTCTEPGFEANPDSV